MRLKGLSDAAMRRVAALDTWRNLDSDIEDALQHQMVELDLPNGVLDPSFFDIKKVESFDYRVLMENYAPDVFGGWGFGEFLESGYSAEEIEDELASFRGDDWAGLVLNEWLVEGFPAIVVIDGFPDELSEHLVDEELQDYAIVFNEISDGRGRASAAYGFGIETLPAVILTPKNLYEGEW